VSFSAGSLRPLLAAGWGLLALVTIAASTFPAWPGLVASFAALPHLVRPVTPEAFAAHWCRVLAAAAAAAIAVLAAAGLGAALGRVACRRLRAAGAMDFCARALAGLAVIAATGLGVGLAGLLFPAVTTLATLVLVAAGLRAGPRCPKPSRPAGAAAGPFLATAALFAGWGLLAVPPQTWVDTLGYHLGAPAFWGRLHRVAFAPESRFQYPLLFEHLISLTGGLLPPAALNVAILGLLTVLLAAWTARRFGPTAGWLAAAGWLASAQAGFLAVHVKHDLLAAAFLLAAVAAWDGGLPMLGVGAALGWTFAAKYPSAAPGLAIVAAVALSGRRKLFRLALLGAGGLAAAAPFAATCWLLTGNPVFPSLFPGLGWGEAEREAFSLLGCPGRDLDLADPEGLPRAVVRLGSEMTPLAWAGLPLLALGAPPPAGRILAVVATAVLCWALWIPCFRFMVPVFPLLAALGAAGLSSAGGGSPARRRAAGTLAAGAVALGAIQAAVMADFGSSRLAAALGLEPASRHCARVLTTYQAAVDAAGALPASGRVLLVGESRGMPFNRVRTTLSQYVLDDPLPLVFARESRSTSEIAKRFRQLGIASVVLNHVTSEYRGSITAQAFPWPPAALARYRDFWGRWAENLPAPRSADAENGGFAFYRLRRQPGPAASAMSFLPGTEGLGLVVRGEERFTARRLETVLQFAPGVAQLQSRLWTALLAAGEYRAAEVWIRNGLSRGFRSADVWASLGASLRGQGRLRDAAGAFRQAQSLDPANPAYARLLGECEAARLTPTIR